MFLGICCATQPWTWALAPEGLVAGSVIYKTCWILQPPPLELRTNCWADGTAWSLEQPFWSRVLSNIMPKRTLTPIHPTVCFLPAGAQSRVVVSYIPERRVEAEEQHQGRAAAAEGFVWHSRDTHAVPRLPFGSHPRVSALERGMATPTRDSMVFFGQVWE